MSRSDGLSSLNFSHLKSAIDEAAIVAITDARGIITYVNKKFLAISKYSSEELIGKTHKVINSGLHSQQFFAEMWSTIASGKVWEGEIRNRAKDGSIYWVHTTIVPFLDEQGKPNQYVSVRHEITERKLAEEQLKIYAKKLEVSNQELQDFASVAAHDLQEPLRKIQSFSDRLKIKASKELSTESLDYLERIQNSAHRMKILINDLLTYSRLTTKAQPFQKVSLNTIADQVISDLVVRIEETKGKVVRSVLPDVEGDPTQFHQLFLNLIGNALKFNRAGVPPEVYVECLELSSSPLTRGQRAVEISVRDNGIGFEEKYLDRIFTIFQRLHGRQDYEGTGIGLAVCKKIVERHGGHLTAKSQLGAGSTFIFTLPLSQPKDQSL